MPNAKATTQASDRRGWQSGTEQSSRRGRAGPDEDEVGTAVCHGGSASPQPTPPTIAAMSSTRQRRAPGARGPTLAGWGRRAAAIGALAAVALVAGGCGGSDATAGTTTTRPAGSPLTSAEAARVAQMLSGNQRRGGATVAAAFDYSPTLSVRVAGDIDWVDHQGRLSVTSTFADGRPQQRQDLVFEADAVYESTSEASQAADRAAGRPVVTWTRRSVQPDERPIDQVIGLFVSLAATRPDNPKLVAQQGITFERRDQVGGRSADVYRTEAGAEYWLAASDGRLVRFSGNLKGFSGPVVVDVTAPGPRQIDVPSGPSVVDAATPTG